MRSTLVVLLSLLVLMACQKQVSQDNPQLSPADISGKTWVWQGSYLGNGDQVTPEEPNKFILVLEPDDQLSIKTDCNQGGGPLMIDDNKFVIGLYRLTRAYCGDDSLDTLFQEHLARVDRWRLMNGDLMLQLVDQAGFMLFSEANH